MSGPPQVPGRDAPRLCRCALDAAAKNWSFPPLEGERDSACISLWDGSHRLGVGVGLNSEKC